MANADKLDRMKNDVISNFDKTKLKKYLFYLTRKYYESYLKKEEEEFNETIEKIMDVIDEYRDVYINLWGYVYYCLYLNAVLIFSEKSQNNDFILKNISKYDLMEDNDLEEELHHDIKKIFNKDRIRMRYYAERIGEPIE